MKKVISFLCASIVFCLTSCKMEKKKEETAATGHEKTEVAGTTEEKMDKAGKWVADAIAAHGGELYDKAHYEFTFRKKRYMFQNAKGSYTYNVTSEKNGDTIKDVLQNGKLTRTVNDVETELSEKDIAKYFEALNSVIYFATLPHKLNDRAVNKTYTGKTAIKGQDYHMIAVTFDQKGGGQDYDDEFLYWINTDTKTIDYLAYSYQVNDGGVRFRSAYNPRIVSGIWFQDYVNYEAVIGTPLEELPSLYEDGKLKELSRIKIEEVVDLGK